MSFRSTDHFEKQTNTEPFLSRGLSQCKSSCDEHSFDGSKCIDQNSPERTFNSTSIGMSAAPGFGHDFSLIPTHSDMVRQGMPSLSTGTMVQRFPEPATEETLPAPEAAPTPAVAEPEGESAAPEETAAPALIVEDSATELSSGQMRKSEFLTRLRAAVVSTAESAMAGTGQTTADCPYLTFWFGYYSLRSAQHGERALRRYAPEASRATTASEYIPIITQRVRRAVDTWVRTGEVTGLPEGVPTTVPGSSGGGEGAAASASPVMRKAREGGASSAGNPQAIQSELGQGNSLDSGVRSRMESAFGTDFSHVRTHTDTTAAGLSNRLNARAFTVGEHVAFGAGEYKPGSLIGDAIIAHEMAHVVQQRGAGSAVSSMQAEDPGYSMLENDADKSATGALASLWGCAKGFMVDVAGNAMPALRSRLRLQRCIEDCSGGEREAKEQEVPKQPEAEEEAPPARPEQQREEPRAEPEEPELPPLNVTGSNRLVPNTPAAGCIPTAGEGAARTSDASFIVQYEKIHANRFEITLRDREDNDRVLHTAPIAAGEPNVGRVTIPSGIPIQHENHHYELEMIFYNSRGRPYGGLRPRPIVKFEVCRLEPAPEGDHLLFAKAIYAEGVNAGEFPYVRDLVYNRIQWVANCPGDAGDFGTTINTVLNAPRQFASVLNNTPKFQELENELIARSGPCGYTTPPRAGSPNRCRLVNAAIQTEAEGSGNTHEYVFFRSDQNTPSPRAVIPAWHYPGGNYYWEIRNCPPDRQRRP